MDLCEAYRKLASDPNERVRLWVAWSPNIPAECGCEVYGKLASDKDWNVRKALVIQGGYNSSTGKYTHPNIPKECACDIYKRLASDEAMAVSNGLRLNLYGVNTNIPVGCHAELNRILGFKNDMLEHTKNIYREQRGK